MIQLAEWIRERGGQPEEPLWYKHEYMRRLDLRIADRVIGLCKGTIHPDDLLVHGARLLLEDLRRRGLPLYLVSGTNLVFVKQFVNFPLIPKALRCRRIIGIHPDGISPIIRLDGR